MPAMGSNKPPGMRAMRGLAGSHFIAACIAAASGGLGGRLPEAQKAMARLRQLDPSLRMSNLKDLFPIRRSEDYVKWEAGMRKAGLPE